MRPVLALSVAAALFVSEAHALDLPDLTARAGPSVVLLTIYGPTGAKEGTGTGFFVTSGGRVMTNHHVIASASRIEAKLASGRVVPIVGIVADDVVRDLAIVQTAGDGSYPALSFAAAPLRQGDEIVVLGSPHGLSGSLSIGIVAAIRDKFEGAPNMPFSTEHWRVQITAAISPGSSGSPVMNRAGEIVAVAVGTHVSGQNLNFAISGATAKTLLEGVPANVILTPLATESASPVKRNLLVSAAVVVVLGLLGLVVLHIDGRRQKAVQKPPKAKRPASLATGGRGPIRSVRVAP